MILARNSRAIPEPKLFLGNKELKQCKEMKILGLIFDTKLSWKPYIRNLVIQCKQRIITRKALCSKNWGVNQDILMNTYRSFIRAKIDYGCTIYGSAKNSILTLLDPIQTTSIRLAIGALRSSSRLSILAEDH